MSLLPPASALLIGFSTMLHSTFRFSAVLPAVLPAVLLTAAAGAQVPFSYLVVGERASGTGPAIHYVDPATGIATPVVGLAATDTITDCLSVCVDPNDPTTFYAAGSAGGFLGGDVWPIVAVGNRHPQVQKFRPSGMPGFAFPKQFRAAGPNQLMMTVSGGSNNGLYEIDLTAQSVQRLAVTLPNFADDIAVIGSKVYANSDATASTVIEWDLLLGSGRTVGASYPNIRSLAASAGQLLAGTSTGDILRIDPQTGNSTVMLPTGLGAIVAIATSGGASDPIYFAVSGSGADRVYATTNLNVALYTTTNAISDLDIGRHQQPSYLVFGEGCNSTLGVPPAFEYVNPPAIGASFTLRCRDVPSAAPTMALIGALRQPTPIALGSAGAPGCLVYADPFVSIVGTATGLNQVDVVLTVPNDPSLAGAHVVSQFAVLDTANLLGVVTSDGNEVILY